MSRAPLLLACLLAAGAGAAFGPASGPRGRLRGPFRLQRLRNLINDPEPDFVSSYCKTVFLGHMTDYETELDLIRLRTPRSLVELPNMDEDIAGQEVTVCNRDQTGTPSIVPPTEGFSPVAVVSASGDWPQANLVMRVIQYMKPPIFDDLKK